MMMSGVGTQKGGHDQGKVDTGFFIELYLAQTPLGNFHRVFGGPNFSIRRIEKF